MTDRTGLPLTVALSAGQAHESRFFESTLDTIRIRRRRRPDATAADKVYSYPRIRQWCKRRRIKTVIPTRKDHVSDRANGATPGSG